MKSRLQSQENLPLISPTVERCTLPAAPDHELLKVNVPNDGNCMFYCIALAFLMPTIKNREAFDKRFKLLFGEDEQINTSENLWKLLQYYDGSEYFVIKHDLELRALASTPLRARVVQYMKENKYEEIMQHDHIVNNETSESYYKSMVETDRWGGQPELINFGRMLKTKIIVYRENSQNVFERSDEVDEQTAQYQDTIYLIHVNFQTHYNYLLEPNVLCPVELVQEVINTDNVSLSSSSISQNESDECSADNEEDNPSAKTLQPPVKKINPHMSAYLAQYERQKAWRDWMIGVAVIGAILLTPLSLLISIPIMTAVYYLKIQKVKQLKTTEKEYSENLAERSVIKEKTTSYLTRNAQRVDLINNQKPRKIALASTDSNESQSLLEKVFLVDKEQYWRFQFFKNNKHKTEMPQSVQVKMFDSKEKSKKIVDEVVSDYTLKDDFDMQYSMMRQDLDSRGMLQSQNMHAQQRGDDRSGPLSSAKNVSRFQ
jgi:hypothetical protein